ncbi:hypothetical protein, partial [Thiolapillus sp.]|uniref:hypothetical protein n=1 Tax=Thiolapillus sp. TaxID=2017437 RepID=UPI0025E5245F
TRPVPARQGTHHKTWPVTKERKNGKRMAIPERRSPDYGPPGWGFVLFLVSNFFLIQVFWKNRMPVLVVMTLWYVFWSTNGVINHFGW